jgi:AbiV family abortive infection protein
MRRGTLAHAADLLQAAELVMKGKQDHIAYHLAVIAMEEIGKATLVAFDTESTMSNRDVQISFRQYDDHEKKLFWALFVPLMIHTVGDPKGIDALRDAATALHGKRLDSMYVSVSGQSVGQLPRDAVTEEETSALIDMVAFRLEVGVVRRDPGQIPVENRDLFAWWDMVFDEPDARRNLPQRELRHDMVALLHV